eukprot:6355522-Prymnesium_polylepis.1
MVPCNAIIGIVAAQPAVHRQTRCRKRRAAIWFRRRGSCSTAFDSSGSGNASHSCAGHTANSGGPTGLPTPLSISVRLRQEVEAEGDRAGGLTLEQPMYLNEPPSPLWRAQPRAGTPADWFLALQLAALAPVVAVDMVVHHTPLAPPLPACRYMQFVGSSFEHHECQQQYEALVTSRLQLCD